MREIKFRAKIQGHNGFVYGVPHNVYSDKDHDNRWFDSIQYMDDNGHPQVEYIEPDTLSGYTGLLDKNGKEIYESDVLTSETEKPMIVKWSEKFASWCLYRDGWMFAHWFWKSCEPEQCEVIGNIYENLELI